MSARFAVQVTGWKEAGDVVRVLLEAGLETDATDLTGPVLVSWDIDLNARADETDLVTQLQTLRRAAGAEIALVTYAEPRIVGVGTVASIYGPEPEGLRTPRTLKALFNLHAFIDDILVKLGGGGPAEPKETVH